MNKKALCEGAAIAAIAKNRADAEAALGARTDAIHSLCPDIAALSNEMEKNMNALMSTFYDKKSDPESFVKYRERAEELRTRRKALLLANGAYSRALLYYFLHRYMLSGAGEFDLDDRLVLCILLLLLCLAFTDGQVTAASVALFSKNVEYSTENIDILLEIIAERY